MKTYLRDLSFCNPMISNSDARNPKQNSLVCSYTPKVPKIVPCAGKKILPVLLSARFASASLKPISITFPVWGPSTPTWQEPHVVSQSPDSAAVVSWCWARKIDLHWQSLLKRADTNVGVVAKTVLKFSKFASFRSTKMLHLTSQLCLL